MLAVPVAVRRRVGTGAMMGIRGRIRMMAAVLQVLEGQGRALEAAVRRAG